MHRIVFGLSALAAMGLPAAGADYLPAVWGVEEGLPQQVVAAVVQTSGGDLWCGTFNGLARFDGVSFSVFDEHSAQAIPGRGVTALYEDRAGVLWVGMDTGSVARVVNRVPVPTPDPGFRGGRSVMGFGEDRAGDLWVLWMDGTVARWRDGLHFPAGTDVDLSEAELALVNDGSGDLWLVHRQGFSQVTPEGMRPAACGIRENQGRLHRTAAARAGGMWVVAEEKLRRWQSGHWVEDLGPAPWDADAPGGVWFVSCLKESRDGRLLAGLLQGGVAIGRPGGVFTRYGRHRGLPQEWIRCLTEDREGNFWLGTGGGGLVALRQARVRMLELESGLSRHAVRSLTPAASGAVWAATEGGGLHLIDGNRGEHHPLAENSSSLYVWSVAEQADGRVWAGTWGSGLFVREGTGSFHPAPGWPVDRGAVMLLHPAGDGTLWAGGAGGLARLKSGAGAWEFQDEKGRVFAPGGQRSIATDASGGLWVGLGDGRLVHRTGDVTTLYDRRHGLPSDAVSAVVPLRDGTVWLGTIGGGLVRFRGGRASILTTAHGLPHNVISQLLPVLPDHLWAGTYRGICRLSLAELEACADGRQARVEPLTLGRTDGLSTLECVSGGQPGACAAADGRLLFPTNHGIASIRPSDITLNPLPPPVVLESLRVDGRPVAAGTDLPVLGPGVGGVALAYTALSFTAPDRVRFRTWLEGLEPDWQEPVSERVATYRYLPPGLYTFHVMACNNDSVWNREGASLTFKILPHFWETAWFLTLGGLVSAGATGGLVWWGAKRRNAARLAEVERLHALERERARIARDIHDDLGSGLTRIMLLSQSARTELPAGSPAAAELENVCLAAEHLTKTMDEIVWAVDPRHDSLDSLVGYVGSTAQEYLKAANLRFRLEAPDHPPPWILSADCRHGLFLAFKEALHNIIRHARASTVHVRFETAGCHFTLTVEDDGGGFPAHHPAPRPGGGRGLANMRERLAEIGGTCTVDSNPGQGTRITFTVPANLS